MKKCKIKILAQSRSGKIFRCLSCDHIHVEFNNLYFTFDDEQYEKFKVYFREFAVDCMEWQCRNSPCKRKIMIPFNHLGFHALFHAEEIRELQQLISGESESSQLIETSECTQKLPAYSLN